MLALPRTAMSKIKSLGFHLRSNPSTVNLEHQPSKGSISQVEIPHILESRFINLPTSIRTADGTAERIASVRNSWHLCNNV
jgi:hypothetical protein